MQEAHAFFLSSFFHPTLQMKGRWESNTNVWFPFMYSPEMKLLFPKQNYNVLSPSYLTHISVRDLYISRIGLTVLLQGNMWTDPGNIWIADRNMNVEIGNEAARFPEKEYIIGILLAVHTNNKNSRGINYKRPMTLFSCRLFYSNSPFSVITTPFLLIS